MPSCLPASRCAARPASSTVAVLFCLSLLASCGGGASPDDRGVSASAAILPTSAPSPSTSAAPTDAPLVPADDVTPATEPAASPAPSPNASSPSPARTPVPTPVPAPAPASVVRPNVSGTLRLSGTPGTAVPGIGGTWGSIVRQQYSKIGAWNCDQSLFVLLNRGGWPETLFFDGATLAAKAIVAPFGPLSDLRWHPTVAAQTIYVGGNEIGTWNVRTNQQTVLARFPQYGALGIGPWEGNASDDGQWIVLSGNVDPVSEVFVFNLSTRQRHATIVHGFAQVDFATISPSGRHVVVNGANGSGPDRTRVFDRGGNPVGSWTEYGRPSHFDLTLDANGDDIAVGVSKSAPDDGSIIARRLRDGQVTRLISGGYGWHTSARNVLARGTVIASFVPDAPTWGPWSDQLLVLSTRTRDQVTVAARQQATGSDYWSEPQPTFSPDGRMILWARGDGSAVSAWLTVLPDGVAPGSAVATDRCVRD